MADVVVLPMVRIERYLPDGSLEVINPGVVVGEQRLLLPSSDRRNVVELWRVRELREFDRCFKEPA